MQVPGLHPFKNNQNLSDVQVYSNPRKSCLVLLFACFFSSYTYSNSVSSLDFLHRTIWFKTFFPRNYKELSSLDHIWWYQFASLHVLFILPAQNQSGLVRLQEGSKVLTGLEVKSTWTYLLKKPKLRAESVRMHA